MQALIVLLRGDCYFLVDLSVKNTNDRCLQLMLGYVQTNNDHYKHEKIRGHLTERQVLSKHACIKNIKNSLLLSGPGVHCPSCNRELTHSITL